MKKFLQFFIFLFVLMSTMVVVSSATTFKKHYTDTNGLTWDVSFNSDTKKATINAVGELNSNNNFVKLTKRTEKFEIPSYIFMDGVDYTVTAIADNAFKHTISTTDYNKNGCRDEAVSADGVFTYERKSDYFVGYVEDKIRIFGHVTLPEKLESIGKYAFQGTAIYDKVVIPETVSYIGDGAFAYCSGLLEVEIKSKQITKIPNDCFKLCNSLVTITTASEITDYGNYSFQYCFALYNITLSENIKTIGTQAFFRCKAIPIEINLPNATSIGNQAFYACIFLERVNFGTATFDKNVIGECSNLKSITVSDDHKSYKTIDGVLYSKNGEKLHIYPRNKDGDVYEIPEGVKSIDNSACYNGNFKKVVFPSTLTTIYDSAFQYSNIENVYVPDNVTSVGKNAFANCSSLEWVIFGAGVKSLRSDHVSSLVALKAVYYFHQKPDVDGWPSGTELKCIKVTDEVKNKCKDHLYGYKDTPATCSQKDEDNDGKIDGIGKNVCLICGTEVEVAPISHIGKIVSKSSLTCVTNESIFIDCESCKEIIEVIEIQATGHNAVSETVSKDGLNYTFIKCSKCNETLLQTYSSTLIVPGDLNGDSKIDSTDLTLLGKIINGQNVTAKILAGDVTGDGNVDVADYLKLKQHLENWGVTISTEKNICENENHIHIGYKTLHEADCVYGGLKLLYCLDCGEKVDEIKTPALGHKWEYLKDELSTCFDEGEYARTCSVCKTLDQGTYPKVEHEYSWWTLTDEFDYQYSYCKVCVANGIKNANGNNQLFREKVDRSELNEMMVRISEHYAVYYTTESINKIRPIYQSAQQALTQEQVDDLVLKIQETLPLLEYNIADVPNVYIETSKNVNKQYYTDANVIVAYKDEKGEIQSLFDYEATVKIRGNSTGNVSDKYPFNIKFSKDVDLLGSGAGKKYTLLANYYDDSLIRTALAYEMANAFGIKNTSHYKFVNLYIDGSYNGNYMIVTPPDKIAEYSVNIDEDTDFILQYSYSRDWNANKEIQITSPILQYWMQIDSHDADEMTREGWSNLVKTMFQSDFVLLSGKDTEIEKYFDLQSLQAYFLMHEYAKNKDIIWDSIRFYIDDCKIHGGPTWDFDLSFGNISYYAPTDQEPETQHIYWNTQPGVSNGVHHNSATGTWADLNWAATVYKTETPVNPYRVWFHDLFTRSEKFKSGVITYMFTEQETITSIYKNIVDEHGKVIKQNMIDKIYDAQRLSILDNFTIFGFGHKDNGLHFNTHSFEVESSYEDIELKQMYGPLAVVTFDPSKPNVKKVTLPQPTYHGQALEFVREWVEIRNKWLLGYYAQAYPEYIPEGY